MVSARYFVGMTGMNVALVDHMTFCRINKNSKNNTDRLIANIKTATVGTKCVTAKFQNGRKIEVYYNGDYRKFDRNGKLASTGSTDKNRCIEKGHICLNIDGRKIWLERFVAICVDIVRGIMPDSYDGWNANVMDGSGSICTACKLGIPMNLHPDNIEWCFPSENTKHGQLILKLKEKTGHVYSFSAFDVSLFNIYYTRPTQDLIDYCEANLVEVK